MTRLHGSLSFCHDRPASATFVQRRSLSFPRCTQYSYLNDSTAAKAAPAFLRRSLSLSTTNGQTALPIRGLPAFAFTLPGRQRKSTAIKSIQILFL